MSAATLALEAARYIREEADFNRSWVDGRRGGSYPEGYKARRLEIADQREAWASAIEAVVADNAAPKPRETTAMNTPFNIRLTDDSGTLAFAEQLWQRFCEDMMIEPNMAKCRLISGVQVAIRDAVATGETPALFYEPASGAV